MAITRLELPDRTATRRCESPGGIGHGDEGLGSLEPVQSRETAGDRAAGGAAPWVEICFGPRLYLLK